MDFLAAGFNLTYLDFGVNLGTLGSALLPVIVLVQRRIILMIRLCATLYSLCFTSSQLCLFLHFFFRNGLMAHLETCVCCILPNLTHALVFISSSHVIFSFFFFFLIWLYWLKAVQETQQHNVNTELTDSFCNSLWSSTVKRLQGKLTVGLKVVLLSEGRKNIL